MKKVDIDQPSGKSRDQVKAEREAKKLAKLAKKNKGQPSTEEASESKTPEPAVVKKVVKQNIDKKSEEVKVKKEKPQIKDITNEVEKENKVDSETKNDGKSKAQLKAERRALQETQRAKKIEGPSNDPKKGVEVMKTAKIIEEKATKVKKLPTVGRSKISPGIDGPRRVKLFAHLYAKMDATSGQLSGVEDIHSSIARLGAQYRTRSICGSNARVVALLNALTQVISDYKTPPKEEFSRGLEAELSRSLAFVHKCRPAAVSMTNAIRQLKQQVTKCKLPEADAKVELLDWIDIYIKEQLDKAAEAISIFVRGKISNGDVILTYSCSSLIHKILIGAAREGIQFRVIVVDGRPWLEGREMLRRLLRAGIQCTYVLVNAVSFVMSEVTKILLGAHALLANGYVMSRTGSSQIALLGRALNVPVLVCCETHKFSERVQTDSFVHNEIGNPDDLLPTKGSNASTMQTPQSLTPLNLAYDVTPPDLVSAVVTELAVLPCTSVPVILRIK